MFTADMTSAQSRAYARANSVAIAEVAGMLRTAAQHDSRTEALRGDLGKAQAALLDASAARSRTCRGRS